MNDFGKENGDGGGGGGDGNGNEKKDPNPLSFYGYSVENVKPEELEPLNKPEEPEQVAEPEPLRIEQTMEKTEKDKELIDNNNLFNNGKEKVGPEFERKPSKVEKRKPCEDFEQILDLVGSEGKYQKILVYAVLCPIVTFSPFLVLNTVFMWDIPDHWCHVPGKDPGMNESSWKNLTLPWEMGPDGQMRYSQCKMFDNGTGEETPCKYGWEYDTTDYSATIPSEYDWVCDRNHYATDCFTWTSFGSAVGTIIFGIIADKWGRKPVFFLACFVNFVFKAVSLFLAYDYLTYKILQFFGGFAYPCVFTMPALISAELSGTTYRAWIYAVTWMIWVVGNAILPFVAMWCRGWFLFGCVAAAPGILLFLYYPIVHESPRWLITVNKTKPAIKIIMKIAETNGMKVDREEIERMVEELAVKQKKEKEALNLGAWTLFSKFRLAKNTVMLTIAWTMNMLLYYGVTLNTTHMAGNKFINYFILALIELPGGWLAGKLVEITGRRWTQAGFFLLCTTSCLICAVAVMYPNSTYVVIVAALGIKFGVSITSLVVYLQATEIFPTALRSTGSGLASTVSSVAGVLGPYIVYAGFKHVSLPYVLLTICSGIGLLSAACLPETFRQSLPETVEDANDFGKDHKFWSYLPQSKEVNKDTGAGAGMENGGPKKRKWSSSSTSAR